MKDYYMNIHTGSVDTLENWQAETLDIRCLIPVRAVTPLPQDFNPCDSHLYEWEQTEGEQ